MKSFIALIFIVLFFSSCSKAEHNKFGKIFFSRKGCFGYNEKYLLIFDKNITIKKINSSYSLFPNNDGSIFAVSFNYPEKVIRIEDLPDSDETIKFVTIKRTDKLTTRINNLISDFKVYDKTIGSKSNDNLVIFDKSNKIIFHLFHYTKDDIAFNDSFLKLCEEFFKP